MSTQEEAVAVMLDNGVLEWVRQRPPKGTKLYSQARIDQLEKELAEARKDAERWRWANSNAEWRRGEAMQETRGVRQILSKQTGAKDGMAND